MPVGRGAHMKAKKRAKQQQVRSQAAQLRPQVSTPKMTAAPKPR